MTDETNEPTPEPTFLHEDDVAWQEVRALEQADGRRTSVWERWFTIGRDPEFLSMIGRWDPDMVVHRHGHNSHQVVYVLAGGMWCGERWCPAGTHIDLPHGAALGPLVAGPDGVELFEVMMGDPRSWEADRTGFERLLADRGITPLPNPPITLPEWLPDTRSQHAPE
ncbi:MAG: hypothetical protein KDB21_02320 [Acidimicrobiales bacterium]|nr:hypothetical protein [Acidimicrobiales bacterium]